MNFFDLHFSFPTACLAAGLKHDTGAKWIKRGYLVMRAEDREVVGRGGAKMLTARTTLQFLLGAELNRQGLSPYDACEAALCFSHEGDFKGQLNAKRDRSPGHLYPELPGDGKKMRTGFSRTARNPCSRRLSFILKKRLLVNFVSRQLVALKSWILKSFSG